MNPIGGAFLLFISIFFTLPIIAQQPEEVKWLDGGFLYDVVSDDQIVHINLFSYTSTPQNQTEVNLVSNLVNDLRPGTFAGPTPTQTPSPIHARPKSPLPPVKPWPIGAPTDADQYFALLHQESSSLTQNGKLLLLSAIGSILLEGYDANPADLSKITSMDQIFENAQKKGNLGGVCRDIHQFIIYAAQALGFDTAGGIESATRSSMGHAIAEYRDPATGEYYVQNYSLVVATHEKNEAKVVDIATRILGPITQTAYVENRQGHGHVYIPRTERWLEAVIHDSFDYQPEHPLVKFRVGNMENLASFQISQKIWEGLTLNESATYVRYQTSEGLFQVALTGVGIKYNWESKGPVGPFSKFTLNSDGNGGIFHINTPQFNTNGTFGTEAQTNFFIDGHAVGTASINKFNGQLIFHEAENLPFPGSERPPFLPDTTLTPGLFFNPNSILSLGYERQFRYQYKSFVDNAGRVMKTDFDRIDIVVDSRNGKDKKTYIIDQNQIYLFEGAEQTSAVGLRNIFKAAISPAKWGSFSLVSDYSRFISDRSQDPFYRGLPSELIGASYDRKVGDRFRINADFQTIVNSTPYWQFEEVATPAYNFKRRWSLIVSW